MTLRPKVYFLKTIDEQKVKPFTELSANQSKMAQDRCKEEQTGTFKA